MGSNLLSSDIKYLPGVGPKKAELLFKELKVSTFEDLLYYFPYKYIDRTRFYKVNEVIADLPYVQLKGRIKNFQTLGSKFNQRMVADFIDDTGSIELVWFKGIKWIKQSIKPEKEYIVFGKPTEFNNKINIAHPEIEESSTSETKLNAALQAAYNTSEKLKKSYITSKSILKLQYTLLEMAGNAIEETLPEYLKIKYKLISLKEAIFSIHFPKNNESIAKAEFRLKFEELFYIQLNLLKQKVNRDNTSKGNIFTTVGEHFNTFYKNNLPFELTSAQKRVIKEIRRDMGSGRQMNRLLQGDVGSGKTLVSVMCMLIALDNGFQTCLMAPTEILAQQHFVTISEFLKGLPIQIKLLTGSTKRKERTIIHEQLLNGEIHIILGTHALIEDVVQFKNLGLVIIDEQHKFGVAQRARLWKKNEIPPHVMVMTATPIPRTLAMTIYGDLDISVIDELPPGRKSIKTTHFYDSQRLRLFDFLTKQIGEGRQVYIVYPLINESEKMDFKDLTDGYESISRAFPPPKYCTVMVHGKMKPQEKEDAMQYFIKGIAHIMVATTVIEVGVNVANASVMVIESAERFGLSQLHQLRGRVGRGASQSFCILMTSQKLSNESRKRIQTMLRTTDGFEIAEDDLKLRGPGDIEGTQQSGIPFDLKIANLAKDGQILQLARDSALDILKEDKILSKPEHEVFKQRLNKLNKEPVVWREIS